MPKAKAHPAQIGFDFEMPHPASAPAALAGLERQICAEVGVILNSDSRPRELIAAEVSVLLGEEVSRAMLDAYSSPAREGHKVPMSRFLALVAVTQRYDRLDLLLRPIGAAVLVGEEIHTARLGHIDREIAKLKEEQARLKSRAPLIRGGK
ncbi:MAG: hypothetical protein KGJ57_18340 [Sphingomonadales bacterium]|nr:hypothetical protein [Sphingomonadales bacterium]MDE2171359.1 hypothetical protein [Sphingomonadales bacterium]